jgi:hypothetical protein
VKTNIHYLVVLDGICTFSSLRSTGGMCEFVRIKLRFKCYVLWTVRHVGIILVNDQSDAQFFVHICLFKISACFQHSCAHHHQENCINTISGICHLHTVTFIKYHIDIINSPDDEHTSA